MVASGVENDLQCNGEMTTFWTTNLQPQHQGGLVFFSILEDFQVFQLVVISSASTSSNNRLNLTVPFPMPRFTQEMRPY